MRAEYINPFIEATVDVFKTMLGCEVERTGLAVNQTFCPQFDITGIIGLSGRAHGDVVISFERDVALKATEALVGGTCGEITEDVVDTVGELTNMIAGNAKTQLESLEMSLALPTVIVGHNHSIRFPSKVKPLSLPFQSKWGNFNIEVGLIESPVDAHIVVG
ncbi:chemotaxis protein CheX [Aeoliella sp. ICT_H6.2]|uniref:Chemotaxis protein CheX n=1 Tax=Aeoliella straminimaris TaxID=2954799 RepID=A0A9X2JGP8_9BACT|nr:chemotaxis protein CheX [Aeoliella straminimaris]MCO6043798.1 chemotaxis protein CheX [Aeoliella straminimaris]